MIKQPEKNIPLQRLYLLFGLFYGTFREIYVGFKTRCVNIPFCMSIHLTTTFAIFTKLDRIAWLKLGILKHYPTTPFWYFSYIYTLMLSGFLIWGFYREILRRKLIQRLALAFDNAGLRTRLGRAPVFISDICLEGLSRKLRLHACGVPLSEYNRAKETLEATLQIHIDDIRNDVSNGTIDIIYSLYEMPMDTPFPDPVTIPKYSFMVGMSRGGPVCANLKKIPHFLIAGYTSAGKSSFLRQAITTLYVNHEAMEFSLIDLKGGLEFQLFENLPRVRVISKPDAATSCLVETVECMEQRMKVLKENNCADFDAFLKIPFDKRIIDPAISGDLARHIVVIDEAAVIFLAGATSDPKNVQIARRTASQIAALGRAVGIHLIVATQRPDRNAVDPLTKTNLQGRICYRMADNASSMTILDSGRATDLPNIQGRAIWKGGMDLDEVQTPWLSVEEADALLRNFRIADPEKSSEVKEAQSKKNEAVSSSVTGENKTAGTVKLWEDQS